MCPAEAVKSADAGSPTGQPSHTPGPEAFQTLIVDLLTALLAEAQGIRAEMAQIREGQAALIQAMAEGSDPDPDEPPTHYLNGRPVL